MKKFILPIALLFAGLGGAAHAQQPPQYDQNGNPIYPQQPVQYDQFGNPIYGGQPQQPVQYDQNGNPIYGGQPQQPVQYDQNGNPIYAQPGYPPQQQPAYDDDSYDDDDEDYVSYDADSYYDDGYDPNAYTQFESALSPYGSWVDVADYGHVWVPSSSIVGAGWSPYSTGGHWVLTDYGWTWVSDWDWGWAPFHYGRWITAGAYGWCWVPGTMWGPAWVSWRWGGGYAGWAPLGPRGVVVGAPPPNLWHFTTAAQLGAAHPVFVPPHLVPSIYQRTNAVTNVRSVSVAGAPVRYNAGPPPSVVSRTLGHPVTATPLHQVAPRALPRPTIAPRAGVPVQSRPWVQGRPATASMLHSSGSPPPPAGVRPSGTYHAMAPHPMTATTPGVRPTTTPPTVLRSSPSSQSQPIHVYGRPTYTTPHYGSPAARPTYTAPRYNAPTYTAPRYNAPTYTQPRYNAPTYTQPRYNAPAPTYSAPRYSAPAPHYSAPSYSAPHYSAPTQHFSAPSYSAPHYSAPAPSYSAPHFSGGGFSGGGRHR